MRFISISFVLLTAPLMAQLPVTNGGTGATTGSGARTNLGAAASGDNQDLLSIDKTQQITMNSLSTPGTPTGTLSAGGSLVNGTNYYAEINALSSNSSVVAGVCVYGCTPVGSVSGAVTATSVNKQITWSWTAVTGAVGYLIWMNTANSGFTRFTIVPSNSYLLTTFPGSLSTGTPPTINLTGEILSAKAPSLTIQQSTGSNGIIDHEALSGASINCCETVNTNPFIQYTNIGTGTELINFADSPASTGQGFQFHSNSSSGTWLFINGTGAFAEFDAAANLNFAGNTVLPNATITFFGNASGAGTQLNDTAGTFTNGDLVSFDSVGGTVDSGKLATSVPTISATTPSATQIVCWKSATQIGHCTTALAGTPPTCTCT